MCPLLIFFGGISKNLGHILTEWQFLSINYIYTSLYKYIEFVLILPVHASYTGDYELKCQH